MDARSDYSFLGEAIMRFNTQTHWYFSLYEARAFTSSQVRLEQALRLDISGFITLFCVFSGIYFISPYAFFPQWENDVANHHVFGVMLTDHVFLYKFMEYVAINLLILSWYVRFEVQHTKKRFHNHHFATFDELNPQSVMFPIANSYGFFRPRWMNITYYMLEVYLFYMTAVAINPFARMNLVR